MAVKTLERGTLAWDPLAALRDPLVIKDRSYFQQYANIYHVRLVKLKRRVVERARERWRDLEGFEHDPPHVGKVLEVKQGRLCWLVGTVYLDMPLKPNILDEITKEHWITAPPPRPKYTSPQDEIMLEDESGRVKLIGSLLRQRVQAGHWQFVTGIIIAALGAETTAGDFEVVDICSAGLPEQDCLGAVGQPDKDSLKAKTVKGEQRTDTESDTVPGKSLALLSGLSVGAKEPVSLAMQLMAEHLIGEVGGDREREQACSIARLIIAGNSLSKPDREPDPNAGSNGFTNGTEVNGKKAKKYGYDASVYSSAPSLALDGYLSQLCQSISVDLLAGDEDPASATLPQQPLHFGLFTQCAQFQNFQCRGNPYWCRLTTQTGRNIDILTLSGQTLDDIYKYVEHENRLEMAENFLQWQHIAPTAPDTLWCYPFQDRDPFILSKTPHLFVIGNQPKFETKLVRGEQGQVCRIVLLPRFRATGQLVLVDLHSSDLETQIVQFGSVD